MTNGPTKLAHIPTIGLIIVVHILDHLEMTIEPIAMEHISGS